MLSNREFSGRVAAEQYPDQVEVPLDEPFANQSGKIQNLLLERFTSAAIIESVAGSARANHYHKTDWHYSYVVSGKIQYYWRPAGGREEPKSAVFPAGTMFFTPPMVEHAMFFPEATSFITFARNIRDHEHHESDVIRVKLIEVRPDPNQANSWVVNFPVAP